jgi:hypothetical protein
MKINSGIGISIGEEAQVNGTLPKIDKLASRPLDHTIPTKPAKAKPTPIGTPWKARIRKMAKIIMPLTSGDTSASAIF